jgi:hypothetical protein
MSLFDVYDNQRDKRGRVQKFIDGLALSVSGTFDQISIPSLTKGLTFGYVGQKTAASGVPTTDIAQQITEEAEFAVNDAQVKANNTLLWPIQTFVTRPISTAMLAANDGYQQQAIGESQNIKGPFLSYDVLSAATNPELFRKAWIDSRGVSPMQAFVGYIGDNVNGTQGTDKIIWSSEKDVSEYFDHGIQRWITWGGDTAIAWWLDPGVVASAGIGFGARKYITRPVSSKRMNQTLKDIDDAVINYVNNDWSTFVGFAKENAGDPALIARHSMMAGNRPLAEIVAKTASYGNDTGDYQPLARTLKVGIGDPKTIDELAYDTTLTAQELSNITGEVASIKQKIADLKGKPITSGSSQFLIGTQRKNALENYRRNILVKDLDGLRGEVKAVRTNLEVLDDIIAEVPVGSIGRQTVSRFKVIEQSRVKNAIKNDANYWQSERIGPFAYVTNWINPSGMLQEYPAYYATVGGIAGDRSHLEYAARVRQYGKATAKSGNEQRELYNNFFSLREKTQQLQAFDELDEKVIVDVIKKEITIPKNATPEQMETFNELVQIVASKSTAHRNSMITKLVDENYTIDDGFGSAMYVKELSDFQDSIAFQIAQERGTGSKVTQKDIEAAKAEVRAIFAKTPSRSPQVPAVHFGLDIRQFSKSVRENRSSLQAMFDELVSNPRYKDMDMKEIVSLFSDEKSRKMLYTEKIASAPEKGLKAWDTSLSALDTFYTQYWKPTTLASVKYATRNVGDGWQRGLAISLEWSRDYGVPAREVLASAFDRGVWQRYTGNKEKTFEAQKSKYLLYKYREEFKDIEVAENSRIADALFNTSDSVFSTFTQALNSADDIATAYAAGRGPAVPIMDDIRGFSQTFGYRILDSKNVPDGVDQQLLSKFVDGDHAGAFDILASSDERFVLDTLAELQKRVRKERDSINEIFNKEEFFFTVPNGAQVQLGFIYKMLEQMDFSIQNTANAAILKATARNKAESFINKTDVLRSLERYGEGEFQVTKSGLMMDDSFAGIVGDMMRKEISSANTVLATVFGADRVVIGNILNGRVRQDVVSPFNVVPREGNLTAATLNTEWAPIAADYANRQLRDAVTKKLTTLDTADPASISKVTAWAKSNDPEAVKWRELMAITISNLENKYDVNDPISLLVQNDAIFLEGTLPRFGIDGRVVAPLVDDAGNYILTRRGEVIPGTGIIAEESGQLVPGLRAKAVEGKLTAEDMNAIPERQRVSVSGNVLEEETGNIWERGVQKLFEIIGTKPEDLAVKNPIYRMVYQAESRRIASLWKDAGRSDDWINANADKLRESAHRAAYKTVMERLYSVQRKTDPAETLRLFSPFWMAKQNSNRFWFGYAARNPQAIPRYFLIWSSPSRVFDVENEDGQDVEFVNPFDPKGAAVKFTLPETIASKMGMTEGDRMSASLGTYDLINNGFYPIMPEFGAPVYDFAASAALLGMSGSLVDPEPLLIKFGVDPNKVRDLFAGYVKTGAPVSERDKFFNFLINPNAWMRSVLTAGEDVPLANNVTGFLDPAAANRFAAGVNKNFKFLYEDFANKQVVEGVDSDITYLDQITTIADLTQQAIGLTIQENMWEAFFSFLGPVGSIKIEKYADIKAKELRQYQDMYGYDEGKYRFMIDNTKIAADGSVERYGSYTLSIAEGNTRETNPFGVIATPQTVKAINYNKDLWTTLTQASMGKDVTPDNKVVGMLFNMGDRNKDFSETANAKLYQLNVKRANVNREAEQRAMAVDMGYDEYFTLLDKYESEAESNGIIPGSKEFKDIYGEDLKAAEDALAKRNPIWANDSSVFNMGKSNLNTQIILEAMGDENYVNTIVKNNRALEALYYYMEYRKPMVEERLSISDNEKTNIYNTNAFDDLVAQKEDLLNQLIAWEPTFEPIAKYYLKRDPLLSDGELARIK